MMARTPLKNLKNIYTVSVKFLSFGSRLGENAIIIPVTLLYINITCSSSIAAGCTISATTDGIFESLEISTEIPDEIFNRVMLRNKKIGVF